MFVYRLASRKYPPNNSEGARTYGGRWNMAGTPAIYASTTRSLAALEVIIHNGAIPWDYQAMGAIPRNGGAPSPVCGYSIRIQLRAESAALRLCQDYMRRACD